MYIFSYFRGWKQKCKMPKVVHSLLKLWTPTVRPWMLSILSQEILSSISPSNSTILRQLCNVPVGRWDLQQAGFRTTPGCPCPTETLRIYRKDKPSLGKGSEPAPVAVAQNSLNHSSAKLQDIRSICISGCAWTFFFERSLVPTTPTCHWSETRPLKSAAFISCFVRKNRVRCFSLWLMCRLSCASARRKLDEIKLTTL